MAANLKKPSDIVATLEEALDVAKAGNMKMANLMIISSKYAIQALALEFARERMEFLNAQAKAQGRVPLLP